MRLEIRSNDRIGISQEILHIFSKYAWNIRAIEVVTGVTYVHVNHGDQDSSWIIEQLYVIDGVSLCQEIEQMPSEKRENHLRTLLNRIPNPIIDLDETGKILALNQAATALIDRPNDVLEGVLINTFIDQNFTDLMGDKVTTHSLIVNQDAYIAEVSPVLVEGQVRGALLMLRTINSLGKQMSLMQSQKEDGIDQILGNSEIIQLLKQQTRRFAQLTLPVLIQGETGTGKELIARGLHQESAQSEAAFLALNCAALPEHLLESELFGYATGAFTGAQKGGKPGLLELADGGTVFLDEIAEMSIYLQAKLLRFLQDYCFRRVGGNREIKVNVRIISATHQNLQKLIEQGTFRADLYYRLNVLNLVLPPLRQRGDDISLLVKHFIKSAALQVNMPIPLIDDSSLALLQSYAWPGNIRQLQNILFRLVALNKGKWLSPQEIKDSLVIASGELEGGKDHLDLVETKYTQYMPTFNEQNTQTWSQAQAQFEENLLCAMYPLYPSTRKLAKRLGVSHNKIAMKLKEHGVIE
jgi:TyrR family helix-turn-helix protein